MITCNSRLDRASAHDHDAPSANGRIRTDGSETTSDSGGRDPKTGRFVRGNTAAKGKDGNKYASRVQRLRRVLLDKIGEREIQETFDTLMSMVRDWDLGANKLLLAYACGRLGDGSGGDTVSAMQNTVLRQTAERLELYHRLAMAAPHVADVVMEAHRKEFEKMTARRDAGLPPVPLEEDEEESVAR